MQLWGLTQAMLRQGAKLLIIMLYISSLSPFYLGKLSKNFKLHRNRVLQFGPLIWFHRGVKYKRLQRGMKTPWRLHSGIFRGSRDSVRCRYFSSLSRSASSASLRSRDSFSNPFTLCSNSLIVCFLTKSTLSVDHVKDSYERIWRLLWFRMPQSQ